MDSDHKEALRRMVGGLVKGFGYALAAFAGATAMVALIQFFGIGIFVLIFFLGLLWAVYSTILEEVREERQNGE